MCVRVCACVTEYESQRQTGSKRRVNRVTLRKKKDGGGGDRKRVRERRGRE